MRLVHPREGDLSGRIVKEYSPDGFSKVYIVERRGIRYYVLEDPKVSGEELKFIRDVIESQLIYLARPSDVRDEHAMRELLKKVGIADEKLVYLIIREVVGYKILHPLIMDEYLEDILCTRAGLPLVVLHQQYGRMDTNIVLSEEEADDLVRMLAYKGGKTISRFMAKLDSVILPTGDRARLVYRSEVSPTSNFTIRKFPRKPWTPPKMLATGMISTEALAWLWLAIEYKLPVIMFGAMGSAKTSLQNTLGMLIKPDSSVSIVADCPELKVPHPIKYEFYTRMPESIERLGEITMEDLIAHALRASVDYVLVNEVRFREARAFAQAVATGHGGITTFHASDMTTLFGRLKDLGVERSIAESLRIFVHCAVFLARRGDEPVRLRRVRRIYFLKGLDGSWRPDFEVLYDYNASRDILEASSIEDSAFLEHLSKVSLLDKDVLLREHDLRRRFLDLVLKARERDKGVEEAEVWFRLLKQFYADKLACLKRLEALYRGVEVKKPRYVIQVSEEELEKLRKAGVRFEVVEA